MLWIGRTALAAVLAAGAAGCSDSGKNPDPKPVNVKEDPRIKRGLSATDNKPAGQLPAKK